MLTKSLVCSYAAARNQTLAVDSGRSARGTLYLVSTDGAAVSGAKVSITDGRRTVNVRTGRGGKASFTLAAGRNRSARAVYAGGSRFGSASIVFRVRNHG